MCQLLLLEGAVLQVAHDRIQFGHGIADRRTSRKHYAAPAGDLIQIATLAEDFCASLVDNPATLRIFVVRKRFL